MIEPIKSIIVVGASAGGLRAISQLVALLHKDLNTAVLVVLHVSRSSMGDVLVKHIQKSTSLHCQLGIDGATIQKGHLYIAPPDFHLMVNKGQIRVTKGPHENRWRPSIDVLFRSAAANYGANTIGIILTGLLDDGTSGMWAIKSTGGIAIVQEPSEAEFEDMPSSVLNNMEVDYRLPIADMGYVIKDIFTKPMRKEVEIPDDIQMEVRMTEKMGGTLTEIEKIAVRSNYNCPDCGGALFERKEGYLQRYRCYNGHAYTENILLDKQTENLEESLWVSVRMLEERKNLLLNMAKHHQQVGNLNEEERNRTRAAEMAKHIDGLKQLLAIINKTGPDNQGLL